MEIDDQTVSLIDFLDVWDLSDNEIEELIVQKININIDSSEGIEKFNTLLEMSLDYLKDELLYNKVPKRLTENNWKFFQTKEDIIIFLKETKNPRWILNCTIARIAYGVNQVLFNERVIEIQSKTKSVYENKLKAPLQINYSWEGVYKWQVELAVWWGKQKKIYFSMTERWKKPASVISKGTRDPDYLGIEAIGDLYGFTFTLENREDIPVFMQFIAGFVFKRWIYDIKNKWLLDKKSVEKNQNIREDFRQRLLPALKDTEENEPVGDMRKEESSDEYEDIKIVSPRGKDDRTKNLSLEIKFTLSENRNEQGLSMQGVYVYQKKITEAIRLNDSVNVEYIETTINSFIDNLETILIENVNRINTDVDEYKKELFQDLYEKWYITSVTGYNRHVAANIDKYLKQWLGIYFREDLIVERKSSKNSEKYTNERRRKVREITAW